MDEFEVDRRERFYSTVGEKVAGREDTEFSPVFLILARNKKNLRLIIPIHDLAVRVNRSVAVNACKNKNSGHQVFPVKSEKWFKQFLDVDTTEGLCTVYTPAFSIKYGMKSFCL